MWEKEKRLNCVLRFYFFFLLFYALVTIRIYIEK